MLFILENYNRISGIDVRLVLCWRLQSLHGGTSTHNILPGTTVCWVALSTVIVPQAFNHECLHGMGVQSAHDFCTLDIFRVDER